MMKTYSFDEMLDLWRLRRGLTPLRDDCEISRSDGIDAKSFLTMEIDAWYDGLLAEGALDMVEITDIADRVALMIDSDGSALIDLPDNCRRVVSVRLNGWKRDGRLVAHDDEMMAMLQASEFTRGGACQPVVITDGHRLRLYSPVATSPGVASLRCVIRPDDGSYCFDDRALSKIESLLDD